MTGRKLHIGALDSSPGWETLNANSLPGIDHVCDARNLSCFEDGTFQELYASHVLEHFDYRDEVSKVLAEWFRVLAPGGRIFISVPDLEIISRLYCDRNRFDENDRFMFMRMILGGHSDPYDYHLASFNEESLTNYLLIAGFVQVYRVDEFRLFQDTSSMRYKGEWISLNLVAHKSSTETTCESPSESSPNGHVLDINCSIGNGAEQKMIDVALKLYAAGSLHSAMAVCKKILVEQPDNCAALHLLGVIQHKTGNSEGARSLFVSLLETDSDNPVAWSNYGVICLSLGETEEARRCFENAVRLAPDYADAWNNLGSLWEKNDISRAEECFRHALELNPELVDACNNLALVCKKLQRYNQAIELYRKSLDVKPCQAVVLGRLAELLEQASDIDGARAAYSSSIALEPDDALRIKMETLLPVILESAESIEPLREELMNAIKALARQPLHIAKTGDNARTLFFLAYHGLNDRLFHENMGQLYRQAAPQLSWQAPHVSNGSPRDGRIRVGFISRFFYNHTIAKLNIGYVEQLDRSRFHVTVLVIATGLSDAMTQRFQRAADDFILLTGDLAQMRGQAASRQLDILLYTDIGMEPWSYFLAFSRLAHVQCVTWGHPATSGIDTIDYFISHQDCETEASLNAYSEKLFCLSPAATCTCYARPELESSGRSLESFGIAPGFNIYYCPQSPFKIHPDFDPILAGILERDPLGLIVLLRGGMPQTEVLLRERFRKVIPNADRRIQFIDPLPFRDYMAMMEQAHVVLDTPHFSGGNSSVEGFAVGAPIVTLPSEFLKGRLTYAWYITLGIEDCIARNAADYVDIAVGLGTDRQKRDSLRQRIRAASPALFDDLQAVRELETFFERVAGS